MCVRGWGVPDHFLGLGAGMTSLVGEADATRVEFSEKSNIAFPALCMGTVGWGPDVGTCR